MADVDRTLVQHVFDVAQQQWVADVKHHSQSDDLQANLEVPERGTLGHTGRLAGYNGGLTQVFSDNTNKEIRLAALGSAWKTVSFPL